MTSAMRPYYVTFDDPPPPSDLRLTPGKVYDVLSMQIGIKRTGERSVYLVIQDDAGTVDMLPADQCVILDVSQIG